MGLSGESHRHGLVACHYGLHVLGQDGGASAAASSGIRGRSNDPAHSAAGRHAQRHRGGDVTLRDELRVHQRGHLAGHPGRRGEVACELVAIDEAEMFGEELTDVANRLATDGYQVIISGLDTDFAGRPFGAMPTLLAVADSVTKLTAICTFPGCGADATRSQRLVNNQPAAIDDPLIVIGGTESVGEPDRYEARCRHAPSRGSAAQRPGCHEPGVSLRSFSVGLPDGGILHGRLG